MIPIFKSITRPILDNAAPVWQRNMRKHIDQIESVQRHFTRCIVGIKDFDIEKRMRVLNLVWSIEEREGT